MIVSHRQIYNPKIDFVICRVLLNYLPSSYDVARLQACFEKHTSPTEVFERQIVAIRDYFAANDICTSTRRSIKELFNIVTGEVIDLINLDLNRNLTLSGVCELVHVIEQINPVDKLSLFKILILTKYCDGKRVPIIPYHSHSKNLYNKIIEGDISYARALYESLEKRTQKFCCRHGIEDNIKSVQQVQACANEFLKDFAALDLYLYGSLATGSGNEYSDIDIMAVFSDDCDLSLSKQLGRTFWSKKLPIPFDFYAIAQSDFNKGLKPSIQRTLRKIRGEQ